MARVDVTQDTVLERIVERLRSQLELSEQRCYDTFDPDSPLAVPPGGEFFITVSPGPGRFVDGEQAIGNITEEWSIIVSIFIRMHLDKSGRDSERLRQIGRGMFAVKQSVLKALSGHDLEDDDDQTFLRQLLYATNAEQPRIIEGSRELGALTLAQMKIVFGVEFDWELT